jgi:transposase-like protein
MPPVDRRNPTRARASESTCSLMEFVREFLDDETCLTHIWRERFAPDGEHAFCQRCEAERVFKRYKTAQRRPCWFCSSCGHRIHPLVGTIFEGSSTSLHLWFYAMYLITSTRCGISAKHLERELGVTYKTAWRMFTKIRNQLMADGTGPLAGEVEADETFVGGKLRESDRARLRAQGIANRGPASKERAVVFGAVERGGRVRATVIGKNRNAAAVSRQLYEFVLPGSMVYTDDWAGYDPIHKRYLHRRINHSAKVYVRGDIHTQQIEGFFGLFKTGVRGAHHAVSYKWLQGYLNEWTWRYNRRESETPMFRDLLAEAVR